MATNYNKRKKNLLALFLSLMMATTAAGFAACNEDTDDTDNSSSSSGSTTTETDSARITNGSFEFTSAKETDLIVTSGASWSVTKNTGADTSKTASGIIDVSDSAWDNLTKTNLTIDAPTTETAAAAVWETMSAYDKLKFYEAWEDADNDEDVEDLDFYDKDTDDFNIDAEDIPTCENPGSRPGAAEDDTKVLMLHNSYDNKHGVKGTAYKATSSTTITVGAGTSAIFSVWVKTQDLTYSGGNVIANRGAYIGVTHTVGGQTLDQMQVKNINTETDASATDGWVEYEFYLRGCSFADSTFTIVLGLGLGNSDNVFEYVDGYAFFDDVTCEIVSNEKFASEVTSSMPTVTLDSSKEEKIFDAGKTNKSDKSFVIDLYTDFTPYALPLTDDAVKLTTQKKGAVTYVAAEDNDPNTEIYGPLGAGFDISRDVTAFKTLAELKTIDNAFLKARLAEDFADATYPFADEKVLMMMSAGGANYTAKLTDAAFTLDKGERVAVSFFVKTSDMKGITTAQVSLREGATAHTISSIDTTGIVTVDIDDKENIYDGWQQCFFFVENDTDKDGLSFSLEFSVGPTEIVGTTKASYYAGYAAFTGFQINPLLTEQEFGYTKAGTYAQTVSLTDANKTEYSSDVFDSPAYVPTNAIETGIAQLKNYTGVYGGSAYVNGAEGLNDTKNGEKAYAGLISKEYLDNYVTEAATAGDDYWLNKMNLDKAALEALLGDATQPLLIYNNNAQAYGFLGASTSFAANAYTAVSVRVKVSQGAKAYVYLTDTTDLSHESVLSIGRQISYWYDADGNVCASNPTAKDFNKKTDVAFKLGANGLYTVNEKWQGKTAELEGKYFANLANYDVDSDGNLVVAEGGVSYDYSTAWDNEGLDGIAYYAGENGKFYADKAKTVEVLDLATVSALKPRYAAINGDKSLFVTVTGDQATPVWQTVTFYIHTGEKAKDYRLEVWSGSRNGSVKNTAGSYVLFDSNTLGALDQTKYDNLVSGAIDTIMTQKNYATEEQFKAEYAGVFYNAFSFFDQASFLRYNADIDENGVGNSYDNYDATSANYADTLAYLAYENDKGNTIFADWSQHDITVTPDPADTEEEEEEDTTDDETTGDETNPWLLASSIAIVVAMVIAIVGMALRPIFKKASKRKARKMSAPKAKKEPKQKAKKPAKKAEEAKDEKDPYND